MAEEKTAISEDTDDDTYFRMLYRAYRGLFFKEARKYLDSAEEVEDIVQDVMVRLVENLDTLRGLSLGRQIHYAVTATRNLTINLLIRKKKFTIENLDDLDPYIGDSYDLEAYVQHSENLRHFRTAWKSVPAETRLLLERKYILRQTDVQIASDLGIRPESVRMRLTRAKRLAAKELMKNGFVFGEE